MIDRVTIDSLFPVDLPEPDYWEAKYPARDIPDGAKVTRFAPSPTGSLHIGGVYTATIAKAVAQYSGGSYFVRIEDTDQSREVAGAAEQFPRALAYFRIESDETDGNSRWGPYRQSARAAIYLTYVRELLRRGRAYLCFCTKQELAMISDEQTAAKIPTGYYGEWARWRDAPAERVLAELSAGTPYVVRFRSPEVTGRVRYQDGIRGWIEHDDNRNDAVILKTSATEPRLPTYHLAHAVDDHLMRVNEVIRAEEWISSVPLHHQLFDALGFDRLPYSHVAPLMKMAGSSKRKLSKRKDTEASVDFYIEAGYPADAALFYLRGLANGRLAELPIAQALAEPIRLEECGVAGPLVDMAKLADISRDYIAQLDSGVLADEITHWARTYDHELAAVIESERDLMIRALDVERVGVENPRKDLAKWSEFRSTYGFFFRELFPVVRDPADDRFGSLTPALVTEVAASFADGYFESDEQAVWFEQIRTVAAKLGFAPTPKEYKQNPDAYPGALRDAANVIRAALTGSTRSPDLHAVALALGSAEVIRRVRAVGSREDGLVETVPQRGTHLR